MKLKEEMDIAKHSQWYIHEISTSAEKHGSIIVTMLPDLAELIHSASTTLHNNTYKQVKGSVWKEWEVVIWDSCRNMHMLILILIDVIFYWWFFGLSGVTIAQIYMTHETHEAFSTVWTYFFEVVERIMGCPVLIKFFHGKGISTILVDGSQPQIEGCGNALMTIHDCLPTEEQIAGVNPLNIVEYIMRCCLVHLNQYITA